MNPEGAQVGPTALLQVRSRCPRLRMALGIRLQRFERLQDMGCEGLIRLARFMQHSNLLFDCLCLQPPLILRGLPGSHVEHLFRWC